MIKTIIIIGIIIIKPSRSGYNNIIITNSAKMQSKWFSPPVSDIHQVALPLHWPAQYTSFPLYWQLLVAIPVFRSFCGPVSDVDFGLIWPTILRRDHKTTGDQSQKFGDSSCNHPFSRNLHNKRNYKVTDTGYQTQYLASYCHDSVVITIIAIIIIISLLTRV